MNVDAFPLGQFGAVGQLDPVVPGVPADRRHGESPAVLRRPARRRTLPGGAETIQDVAAARARARCALMLATSTARPIEPEVQVRERANVRTNRPAATTRIKRQRDLRDHQHARRDRTRLSPTMPRPCDP